MTEITTSQYKVSSMGTQSASSPWMASNGTLVTRGDTESEAVQNLERVLRMRQ